MFKKLFGGRRGRRLVETPNELLEEFVGSGSVMPADGVIRETLNQIEAGATEAALQRLSRVKSRRTPVCDTDCARALCFISLRQNAAAIEALKEELRYFPENPHAVGLLRRLQGSVTGSVASSDPEFRELLEQIKPYTMVWQERLASLFELAKIVCTEDVPGNFVECGVAAGGSSALLGTVISRYSRRSRRLFSCDTYEGMPDPTIEDTHAGQAAEQTGWGAGTSAAPESSLWEISGRLGVESLIVPVKGLFADTLPAQRERMGKIAFLHMDGDWYSSTGDILVNLFDQVVPGGRIQIDDYGHWEGCQRAVAEFFDQRGIKPELHPIDGSGVWMVK